MSVEINPPWSPKPLRTAQFDPRMFEDTIRNQGERLLWERAFPCACRANADSDHQLPDCPTCAGAGWQWIDPVMTYGLLLDKQEDPKLLEAYGALYTGIAKVTLRGAQTLGYQDRITAQDRFRVVRMVGKVREGLTDTFDLPIATWEGMVIGPTQDDTADVSVLHCRRIEPDGTPGDVLVEGVDFVVDDGGIDWTLGDGLGTAPAEGEAYTLLYYAKPRYRVISHPYVVRTAQRKFKTPTETWVPLPVQAVVALDLVENEAVR